MHMTLEEQAAYRNLLDEAALRGGALPNNHRILAKASGDATRWRKVKSAVLRHFELKSDGFWHNSTLDSVLKESQRRAQKQRDYRARAGNAAGNGAGNRGGNSDGSPYPSPSLQPGSLVPTRKKKGRNRVCPHTPTCATWTACTSRIVEDGRRTKAAR
jgi:hypothetical protein